MVNHRELEIRSTDDWVWQVHENQSYLGRVVFRLRRTLTHSCAHCTDAEWISLKNEFLSYEAFVARLFAPDRFNYDQLGNKYSQLHFHAVPRYKKPRLWEGYSFVDPHWGVNWSPAPTSPRAGSRPSASS